MVRPRSILLCSGEFGSRSAINATASPKVRHMDQRIREVVRDGDDESPADELPCHFVIHTGVDGDAGGQHDQWGIVEISDISGVVGTHANRRIQAIREGLGTGQILTVAEHVHDDVLEHAVSRVLTWIHPHGGSHRMGPPTAEKGLRCRGGRDDRPGRCVVGPGGPPILVL